MKIRVEQRGGVTVVHLDESISQELVPIFRLKIQELLEEGTSRIVLEMSRTQYLSSMGLAIIVDMKNRAVQSNGDVRLANPSALVKNLFEITNLLRKFNMYASVEDAVASYGPAA